MRNETTFLERENMEIKNFGPEELTILTIRQGNFSQERVDDEQEAGWGNCAYYRHPDGANTTWILPDYDAGNRVEILCPTEYALKFRDNLTAAGFEVEIKTLREDGRDAGHFGDGSYRGAEVLWDEANDEYLVRIND